MNPSIQSTHTIHTYNPHMIPHIHSIHTNHSYNPYIQITHTIHIWTIIDVRLDLATYGLQGHIGNEGNVYFFMKYNSNMNIHHVLCIVFCFLVNFKYFRGSSKTSLMSDYCLCNGFLRIKWVGKVDGL